MTKTTVIVQSKSDLPYKKRFEISHKTQSLYVPGSDEPIYIKKIGNDIKWSKTGKRFKKTFKDCPIEVIPVSYPKIDFAPKSEDKSKKVIGFNYYLMDKASDVILASRFSKSKVKLDDESATKFFSKRVVSKKHQIKITPVVDKLAIKGEEDPYANNFLGPFKDRRMGAAISLILTLWLINFAYIQFFKTTEKEATLVQVQNKQAILKERKEISKLLSAKGNDPKNQRVSNKIPKVISKNVSKKASEPKKVAKKPNRVAAAPKKVAKKTSSKGAGATPKGRGAPSLKDKLFSRTVKRGSIGRASKTAKTTLRGSSRGADGGSYGSAKGIRGGFATGSGSALSASVGGRLSGNGTGTTYSGGGFGDLGSRVMLSGSEASVSGGLTREQINKVVRRNKKDVNRCYENRLQFSPNLAGEVVMEFLIDASGRVVSSKAGSSALRDQALESCIARKIKGWRFDKPVNGRKVQVSYPFNLTFNKRG